MVITFKVLLSDKYTRFKEYLDEQGQEYYFIIVFIVDLILEIKLHLRKD